MCCALTLSAVCNGTLALPPFTLDPACLQGPIHKSIEWLDRTGMDIIESVSRTHCHCARCCKTPAHITRLLVTPQSAVCRDSPATSRTTFSSLATPSVADTPSACCCR